MQLQHTKSGANRSGMVLPRKQWMQNLSLVFALIGLSSAFTATAQNPYRIQVWRADSTVKDSIVWNEDIVISGSVKTTDGLPLSGVSILFDGEAVAMTGGNGLFSFLKKMEGYPQIHLLVGRQEGMQDVQRTYHPVMRSETYDLVLERKQTVCCLNTPPGFHTQLEFGKKETALTGEQELQLQKIAAFLRDHPFGAVQLTAYAPGHIAGTMARYRQEAIKTYLMDKEGISAERIELAMKKEAGGKTNLIEISVK